MKGIGLLPIIHAALRQFMCCKENGVSKDAGVLPFRTARQHGADVHRFPEPDATPKGREAAERPGEAKANGRMRLSSTALPLLEPSIKLIPECLFVTRAKGRMAS